MYKKESINKAVKSLVIARKHFDEIPVDEIKLAISKGNRKIGRVMNVSLPPILTCANCSECMYYCYDVKAVLQYPNTVVNARARNLSVLARDRDAYFAQIDAAISRRRVNKFFRWHVSGDIVDIDYFNRMVTIARNHTDFVFLDVYQKLRRRERVDPGKREFPPCDPRKSAHYVFRVARSGNAESVWNA